MYNCTATFQASNAADVHIAIQDNIIDVSNIAAAADAAADEVVRYFEHIIISDDLSHTTTCG